MIFVVVKSVFNFSSNKLEIMDYLIAVKAITSNSFKILFRTHKKSGLEVNTVLFSCVSYDLHKTHESMCVR